MKPLTEQYIESIDSWIKQIRNEFSIMTDLPNVIEENTNNIQHNYELILEMKNEIERLREEITTLKFVQLVQLKPGIQQKAYK